jgi:hypothetical protein
MLPFVRRLLGETLQTTRRQKLLKPKRVGSLFFHDF